MNFINANNYASLKSSLKQLGIQPTHELSIIDSVAVTLTSVQLVQLKKKLPIKVTENHQVEMNGVGYGQRRWQPESVVAEQVDASIVHLFGNFGEDVTIGFLDTGLDQLPGLALDLYGRDKAWGTYDAINNTVSNYDDEANGHGTHVASIATNSDYDANGNIYGIVSD